MGIRSVMTTMSRLKAIGRTRRKSSARDGTAADRDGEQRRAEGERSGPQPAAPAQGGRIEAHCGVMRSVRTARSPNAVAVVIEPAASITAEMPVFVARDLRPARLDAAEGRADQVQPRRRRSPNQESFESVTIISAPRGTASARERRGQRVVADERCDAERAAVAQRDVHHVAALAGRPGAEPAAAAARSAAGRARSRHALREREQRRLAIGLELERARRAAARARPPR